MIYEVVRRGLNPHGPEEAKKDQTTKEIPVTTDKGLPPDMELLQELEVRHRVR